MEGVGRQVGHSSWCFSPSLPHPQGKSPLSWPAVPWCIQWISSLPLHHRHATPSGTKHLQEIWVQKFPVEKKKVESGNQCFHPVNHNKSYTIWLMVFLALKCGLCNRNWLSVSMSVCPCDYITIPITLTWPYCKLRSTRQIELSATVILLFYDNMS